jgi:Cu(I)/Ag(I) efflux system membrane fusion protein
MRVGAASSPRRLADGGANSVAAGTPLPQKSAAGTLVARAVVLSVLLSCALLMGCDGSVEQLAAPVEASAMPATSPVAPPRRTFVCPMHPHIAGDHADTCPICGMDLVEKDLDDTGAERPAVTLTPAVMQNMGVRTAPVERGTLWKFIETQGTVVPDDDRLINVHPRTAGWIETLYVRTDGERVERKDDLADYFSPDVLWAQREYIDALAAGELGSFGGGGELSEQDFRRRAGVDLLRYFRVPNMDIMGLERSMEPRSIVPIRAPQGGVVVAHNVREGSFVTPATPLFTIVDMGEVWVMVDLYEHHLAWVQPGLEAEIATPAYPGRSWRGRVEFVYPSVDPVTRTLRARLEFPNPEEALKLNMFVEVKIYGGPKRDVLMLPREAVIQTGERTVAVKALGDGRFQPVEVTTGMWRGDQVELLSGLDEGDEVVVSGQFLIDSESNMQASLQRLSR